MFVPYLDRKTDNRMLFVRGPEIAGTLAIVFFGFLTWAMGRAITESWPSVLGAIVSVVVVGFWVFLLFFRATIEINRTEGFVRQTWGSIWALQAKETPLSAFSQVFIEEHRGQSQRSSLWLKLAGEEQSITLRNVTGIAEKRAQEMQEELEAFLGFEHTPYQSVGRRKGRSG